MIRHATYADMDACLDVFEKASDLSGYYSDFDRDIASQNLAIRIMNPYSLVLVNDRLDGVLVGLATPSIHTRKTKVCNEFLYADSEGESFIRKYLQWAKGWGDAEINFATSFGGKKGRRAERLLERLGFVETGKQFRVT